MSGMDVASLSTRTPSTLQLKQSINQSQKLTLHADLMLEGVGVAAGWIPARGSRAERGPAAGSPLGGQWAASVAHFTGEREELG